MKRRMRLVTPALVAIAVLTAGCTSIPSNTPILLDRTTERIETRSEIVYRVLRTTYDETGFSRQDVEAVRRTLEGVSTANLSLNDKKVVDDAVKSLKTVEVNLGRLGSKSQFADDTRRVFTESVTSLKLVRQVIGTETDRKAVIQDMIDMVEKTKEKP